MATADFPSNGHLQILRDSVSAPQDGVDIVLVPGLGTIPPENWPFLDPEWLATLPASGARARIFAYRYTSPFSSSKPSWESILMLGYELLELLSGTRSQGESNVTTSKPIILVCHSLGGIIAKQALCVSNKQFSRYEAVVNAIAGVMFLSTPHRHGDKTTSLTRFRDILDATTGKTLKIPNSNIEQEEAMLLNLADRFEGISLRTPILSVYELRETRSSSTPLRSKYQQLVSRESCSTRAPLETVVGLNVNHHESCLFTQSVGDEGLPELNDFVHKVLRDATELVELRLEDQDYQYATTSAYSPTMSELPLRVEQADLTEYPSNRATEDTSHSSFEFVSPASPDADARKPLNLPCFVFNTHSANENFCGREDVLKRLATELLPSKKVVTASSTALQQFALCGFGGIGKTEIAREFARRYRDSFDAIFWVMADEVAKIDHDYQQISLALGLEDASECKSQVVSREIVKGWLSSPQRYVSASDEFAQAGRPSSDASWLLIFDNVDDPMILADYWPQGAGSILITSRDPLAKNMFTSRPSGMDLGPLTKEDSLSLFNHLTAAFSEPEEETARKISEALGGVPLAISQMAGVIRRQDLTLSEFLELYMDHEEHASLYETKFDTNVVTYRHSLSTVWAFEKLKPQSRQLLELISFLDPDDVGEDLLTEAATELLSEEQQPFKKSSYMEARADLLQSSLIQRDKQKQKLSVHRIVQDVILTTMDDDKKRELFDQTVRVIWSDWPSAMPKPSKEPELPKPKSTGGRLQIGRWPACAALYPHVLRIHQLWSHCAIPGLSEATKLLFAKLLNEAAWYQKERGRTKDFDGFFDTARSICEASAHPDQKSVLADVYFCLASVAMDTNDFETSRVYKERSFDLVAEICSRLHITDERLWLAYAERGITRVQDRRYEEGEEDLTTAMKILRSLPNYIPRSAEANLGWTLLAQGKIEECNTLLLDILAGRERALGKDDRESARTGLILYALGNLRAVQGEWDESYEFHSRAWRHMRETVGERDFYTANITHKMAEHLFRLKRYEEAISMANTALDIWSVDPNAHKNEISRTTFLKAKLFEATGKSQKATIALRVAARLRKEITKEDRDMKSLTMKDFDEIVAFWAH